MASGKDVYLEKPMTLRLPEALWLRQVMQNNEHMRVQVGTQYMMQQKYREAKRLIAEGGAKLDDAAVTDGAAMIGLDRLEKGQIKLSAGKKRHALVKLAD